MVKHGSLGQQLSEFINRGNCVNFSVWYSSQPRAQVPKADSQGTRSPSLMWLRTLYLILPLCPLATISRTKEELIQKADAGTLLSRGEHVCRCFPMIACNLSDSRNKFVLCRPAFDGYWLFYCFWAGAWLKYRISTVWKQGGMMPQGWSRKAEIVGRSGGV